MEVVFLVKISCGLRGKHFTDFSETLAALRMVVVCFFEMLVTPTKLHDIISQKIMTKNEISPP
jgi:hypothetical protein